MSGPAGLPPPATSERAFTLGGVLIPPKPIELGEPGTLHFAAGDPNGLRSLTWTVTGHSNQKGLDEVYISNRQTRPQIKLSIHQADGQGRDAASRLAFRAEFSKREGFDDKREIFRMPEAPEFAPGWRQAAVILTPSITFGQFPEKRLKKGETIQWFPAPPSPEHLKFYVVIGDAGGSTLTLTDHVGEVGHMKLRNGRFVGVVADSRPAVEQDLELIRDDFERANNTPAAYPFTWQIAGGFTFFLDLAIMLTPQP